MNGLPIPLPSLLRSLGKTYFSERGLGHLLVNLLVVEIEVKRELPVVSIVEEVFAVVVERALFIDFSVLVRMLDGRDLMLSCVSFAVSPFRGPTIGRVSLLQYTFDRPSNSCVAS